MKSFLSFLGFFVLIPCIILYSAFSWGYVATILYNWFILPVFPGIQVFTCIQFAGFMFFINCFVHGTSNCNNLKKEYEDSAKGTIILLIAPWVVLLGGWIFHLFY